jgi:predicted  nucleic acid-binding Zn-ribbon protein
MLIDTAITVTQKEPLSWELVSVIIGVATVIVGGIVTIYTTHKKSDNSDTEADSKAIHTLSEHINKIVDKLNENSNKISEISVEIAGLKKECDHLNKENEDLKDLMRDIEKENFSSISKVSDKVDSIKDLIINLRNR